jgi:hypothetical protein
VGAGLALGDFGPVDARLGYLDRCGRRFLDLRLGWPGRECGPRGITNLGHAGVWNDGVGNTGAFPPLLGQGQGGGGTRNGLHG